MILLQKEIKKDRHIKSTLWIDYLTFSSFVHFWPFHVLHFCARVCSAMNNQWVLTLSNRMFLIFHEVPTGNHQIENVLWPTRREWYDRFLLYVPIVFNIFLRDVDTGDSCRPFIRRNSWFHPTSECCCGPHAARSFYENVLWPIRRWHFVLSIFANFTECACSPCGVKNSLFTKKRRNRWCA